MASLQTSFEHMLHQLSDAESKYQIAETRASEAEHRSEALAAALNESRSRCTLEQQQNHALQLQLQRFEAEIRSSSLLSSKLSAAEASVSELQQKFNDADKKAFVAERRADALVQELRVRGDIACCCTAAPCANIVLIQSNRPASCRTLSNSKPRLPSA